AQPTAPPGCTLTVNAPFFLDASTFCMVDTPDDPAYIPSKLNDENFFAWQPGTISDACLQKHSTQLYQSGRGIVTETTMTLFLVQMLLSAALSAAQPTAPPGCTLTVNAPFFLDASTFCMVDTPDDPAYIPSKLNDENFFAWQPGTISDACLQKHSTQLYQSGRGIVTETTMTLFLVQIRILNLGFNQKRRY
ncbi:uncharacterized protein ISCGN_003719, partial [Ixodes scapularis]